jgi:hypothetical protein
LLAPNRKTRQQLPATLPVSATDTAATFTIPPRATVLLYATIAHGNLDQLPEDGRLYVQPVGADPHVVDWERFQGGRFRRAGVFCYSLPQ